MKRALFTAVIFFAAPFSLVSPGAAQDLAALTPESVLKSAGDDIPTASVMPVAQKPVPVKASHNLRTGTILHGSDLIADGDGEGALDLYVGMELKRSVYAGTILSPHDVGPPTAIERNAIVSLEFVRGPLMITTEGRALDAGAVGETVRVMNLNSKIILTAVVTGPNKAVTK